MVNKYYKHKTERIFSIINYYDLKIITILGIPLKIRKGFIRNLMYNIKNIPLNFKKMPSDLISVIMPVYNTEEEYLREAIESILNQTYKNFEFIIINDGSTNNVEDVIRSYKDDRIVYYKNEVNKGLKFVRNRLISLAKGKYIACMDSDDIAHKTRLEKQIKFLEYHKDIGVLGTQIKFFGEKVYKTHHQMHPTFVTMLESGWEINNPTVMMRSNLDIKYNDYPIAEDYDLWMNLASTGVKFANLSEVLLDYRMHGNNTSIMKSNLIADIHRKIKAITLAKYLKSDFEYICCIIEKDILTEDEINKYKELAEEIAQKASRKKIKMDVKNLYGSFMLTNKKEL